ncbi:hypothetical protein GCK72_024053 [Caenorhabditis remanei]|uniref:VWFA domain-containing protein n=1 Tax=Caenorhabditis remanei TaxID=31234 RepID=A0A6A5FY40_CAERE|nr:hypothetical protein GCK72_024053 [Caenorhabditis remanei]KAF1747588.1 hypothetical protein GCK72_024053 [Caenorhabditis remanei]
MRVALFFAALLLHGITADENVKFDIVFLIDSSKSAEPYYDLFTEFAREIMWAFDVSSETARIGLAVVNGDQNEQPPPVATLNDITSHTNFHSKLELLKDNYADFHHSGQLLAQNLDVICDNSGYSSTKEGFNVDPVPFVQNMLARKQYGMITVGYGDGLDFHKLKNLAGGASCAFSAKNPTELNSLIKPIQRLIMTSDATGGVYCIPK